MFSKEIQGLLQKSLQVIPQLAGSESLKKDLADLVKTVFAPCKLAIIDDDHTALALGNRLANALAGKYAIRHFTLDNPEADEATIRYLRQQATDCDAFIAVGSGTLNDLVKYASYLDGKPYLVFPTAASMNGYLSANASITSNSFKTTLKAHMPQAVFCDWSVIAAAPLRLTQSGLGDALARPTAQVDWLLSHLLLSTPYDDTPYRVCSELEPAVFDDAKGFVSGDINSIKQLTQLLLLSGLGMTMAGGSYPASQGEHMIAHAHGMLTNKKTDVQTFHGEEIAVTSLFMAGVQEAIIDTLPGYRKHDFDADVLAGLYGDEVVAQAGPLFAKKQRLMETYPIASWQAAREKIATVMMPKKQILAILQAAQCPISPQVIGWDVDDFKTACHTARYLRDRFTFLDLI